jgi:FMN reductase
MTTAKPRIVGVGGTTRVGSTTEAALRHALAAAERHGCTTDIIAGTELPIEPYDPARGERSPAAARLVAALREADGVIVASPGYHGSIAGLVKNALDYTEDMRADPRPYLDGRAVGAIVTADGPQALGSTLAALRSVTHALRAWPTPYAVLINARDRPFDADGRPTDPAVREAIERMATQVVEFALMRRAWIG